MKLAAELREAHVRDLAKMRESVEYERERQRVLLQARLRKKRLARLTSLDDPSDVEKANEAVMEIDYEEARELADLEDKFSKKVKGE